MLVSEIKKVKVATPEPLRNLLANIFGDSRQIETFVAPVEKEKVEEKVEEKVVDENPNTGILKRSIALFGVVWLSIYIQRFMTFSPLVANSLSALITSIIFILLDRFLL